MVVLSGGVGGAKLVEGLAAVLEANQLTVIGNPGDDVERHGLWISPDLDIVTYTLAGIVDREKGWGVAGDTFHTLHQLRELGEDTWMNLGDRDLAVHLHRTRRLRQGARRTEVALEIAARLGVRVPVIPPSDHVIQTHIQTPQGWLNFQEFYIREQCKPEVLAIEYCGAEEAVAAPEALRALRRADLIVFAPSNPLASIGPILAVKGVREVIRDSRALRIAVCPIVGGTSLKGPSATMMTALGHEVSPIGVAGLYHGLIDLMVLDSRDARHGPALRGAGISSLLASTVMHTHEDRIALARHILAVAAPARSSSLGAVASSDNPGLADTAHE